MNNLVFPRRATDFLQKLGRGGSVVLTAIPKNGGRLRSIRFLPQAKEPCERWIKRHASDCNIYFHPNGVSEICKPKASKGDIETIRVLHVDVDPDRSDDFARGRKITLAKLTSLRPPEIPPPTSIVFSGNGHQAYWVIEAPIEVSGDAGAKSEVEEINQILAERLGGDHCQSIDHLMRLPGTTNWPNNRKQMRGRTPTLSEVVRFNSGVMYVLDDFKQLSGAISPSTKTRSEVSTRKWEPINPAQMEDLHKKGITTRILKIIELGMDPDCPKRGDNSRSAWLFDVVCDLVRNGISDETILEVILNPNLGISESVLELGNKAERYAIRQVERAHLYATDPVIMELNDQFCVISTYGGKCVILEISDSSARGGAHFSLQSLQSFKDRFMNRFVEVPNDGKGGPKKIPLGRYWLEHPKRRQCEGLVFDPSETCPDTHFNTWQGFAFRSLPGECSKYIDHIRKIICGGNDDLFQYLIMWMARCVQSPESPGEVAIVLRGGQGTGKSFFVKNFLKLFGVHAKTIANADLLTGKFNSIVSDCVVLFADEVFRPNDIKQANQLKSLVTESTIVVERKFHEPVQQRNCLSLIMATNEDWAIAADSDDRRYLVLDVAPDMVGNNQYFKTIQDELDNGGAEALLYYLLSLDISDFDFRKRPSTRALVDQQLRSLRGANRVIYELLDSGEAPVLLNDNGAVFVTGKDIALQFRSKVVASSMTKALRPYSLDQSAGRETINGTQKNGIWLRPLREAREAFVKRMGLPINWSHEGGEWISTTMGSLGLTDPLEGIPF